MKKDEALSTLVVEGENLKRIFDSYLSDKFFILCVKNNSNKIKKFKEEDKEDLMYDKKLLINLFDINKI